MQKLSRGFFPVLWACLLLGVLGSCSNPSGGPQDNPPPSSGKKIKSFTISGAEGVITGNAITVTVPLAGGLVGLTPTITYEGASVSPASGAPQDFFNAEGYRSVTYTVTAVDGSKASWIVTVKAAPLESIAAIGEYLDAADPGLFPLPVEINLADSGGNGWTDLLATIRDASSVSAIALDLSACTMGEGVTEFDPGTADTGEGKIVSLVLPDTAERIKADTTPFGDNPTFKNFGALKSIAGRAVTVIGDYAFRNRTSLISVSFPVAQTIKDDAFFGCTSLISVSFPAAQTIGDSVFGNCTSLSEVSLPTVQTIGRFAFNGCTSLSEVSLPTAQTIGNEAFRNCTGLISVSLPAAQTIKGYAFSHCTSLSEVSLLVAQSIDANAFSSCTSLNSVSLPVAQSIGEWAFYGCTSLSSVSLPAATSIGNYAFRNTGTKTLTLTLSGEAPALGTTLFSGVNAAKTVIVEVPAGAAGYGSLPATYTDAENTDAGPHWGEGFRGKGWTSSGTYGSSGTVNSYINLTVDAQ